MKCDLCETQFVLKIQADNSIDAYPLPVVIICPKCGTLIEATFQKKFGVLPMKYKGDEENYENKLVVGYSSELPILLEHRQGLANEIKLSPFMMNMVIYQQRLIEHRNIVEKYVVRTYRLQNCANEWLPILKHKPFNAEAFIKRAHQYSKVPILATYDDCKKNFIGLLSHICSELMGPTYNENLFIPYWKPINDLLENDKCKFEGLAVFVKTILPPKEYWSVLEAVMNVVSHLEKYLPSLTFLSVGDWPNIHKEFLTSTVTPEMTIEDYKQIFDAMAKVIAIFVGFQNVVETGDYNVFLNANGKMKGITDLMHYHTTPDGLKFEKITDNSLLVNFLGGCFNSRIRNGIGHSRYNIDNETQSIDFYPKANSMEVETIQLIDLGVLVLLNVFHLVELLVICYGLPCVDD